MMRASRWLALAAVIVIQLTFVTRAGAIAPGGNGVIAYVRDGHIYVTGNDRPLAEGEAPSWSPDGSQIAFENSYDVVVMDADGTNAHVVRPYCTYNGEPAWSPNGKELVYASNAEHAWWLNILDLEKGESTELAGDAHPVSEPDWSPDGSKIVFNHFGVIDTIDSDGSHLADLTDPSDHAESPSWSPDGSTIAFSSNRTGSWQIYTMASDGTNVTELTPDESEGGHIADTPQRTQPAWSPDGSQIAYTQEGIPGPTDVYVMNRDGSNRHGVISSASSPSWQPIGPSPTSTTRQIPRAPCVTRESRKIYFSLRSGDEFIGWLGAASVGCYYGAPVTIQRRVRHKWKDIKTVLTDDHGDFTGRLPESHHAYRAVALRTHWSFPPGARAVTQCRRASSRTAWHP